MLIEFLGCLTVVLLVRTVIDSYKIQTFLNAVNEYAVQQPLFDYQIADRDCIRAISSAISRGS